MKPIKLVRIIFKFLQLLLRFIIQRNHRILLLESQAFILEIYSAIYG